MAAEIIDGKRIAEVVKDNVRHEVEELKEKGINPGLAVVLVGEDPASKRYVSAKGKACKEVGIESIEHRLPADTDIKDLLSLIDSLNKDVRVHGILVQLPLPKHLDQKTVINSIAPEKDVDGLGPVSAGKLLLGEPAFLPCTPFGVMKMLEYYGIDPKGKHAVVIGRSILVGKPLALMLLSKNATVTMCHSQTKNLKEECLRADILCVVIGKARFITGDMIKEGAAVIDVGINVMPDGKLVGDVDFEAASKRAAYITPVPGGAGPMTIAMLLDNTVRAAKRSAGIEVDAGL